MTLPMSSSLHRSYQLTCLVRPRVYHLFHYTHSRLLSTPTDGMEKVHEVARDGFKQGHHYDQSRPSYTDEITSKVVKCLFKESNAGVKYNILELGAGTGLFTRKLKAQLGKALTYLATDPSEEFLNVLREQSPDIETDIFSAYKIPLPDSSVQNIVCAQCFHWCANKECLDEMTRVLVPKGRILCVWNNKNWDIDWIHEVEDLLTTYYTVETPRAYNKQWLKVIEGDSRFKCVQHSKFPGIPSMKGDKSFIVDHFSSISVISLLDEDENKEARSKFRAVLDKYFEADEEIQIPLFSEFYCSEKN